MNKNKITLALTSLLSVLTIAGANAKASKALHGEQLPEIRYSEASLSALKLSSISIIDDDQFVFNNALAALDWDSVFESYMPALNDRKSTIMHYAGYYSINPKLLVAIMEAKSGVLSNPTEASLARPFGDLTDKQSFVDQVRDVASQLTQRFYAFRRMEVDKSSPDKHLLENIVPTSAATVALSGLFTKNHQAKLNSTIDPLTHLLTTYEDIFVEHKSNLLKKPKQLSKLEKNNDQSLAMATPTLHLPWSSGWSWRSGGAHGYDGNSWPLSSLDVYYAYGNSGWGGNKPPVYAAHGGTVTWFSRCQMRITHSSGIATNYYHMDNLQYNSGTYIDAGTYIGRYANNKNVALCEGGRSTGPHLHISLMKNGYWESLQGYNFSGYYVQVGNYNYDSNCNRSYLWKNGRTYCHGRDIYKPY